MVEGLSLWPNTVKRMITAKNVSACIGRKDILKNVSLTIIPGQITAVIGPNGAGKTTLLKILSGELRESGGEIQFEDRPVGKWSPKDLACQRAVLPQISSLSFPFTVMDVVLMGRIPYNLGIKGSEDLEIARRALEIVDLKEFEMRNYTTLSGGERQRVHFARVLSQVWEVDEGKNKYLFLDEPTTSLDLLHQHSILRIAKQWADRGIGIFIILHDLNLAMSYADIVVLLNGGELVAFGPTNEILVAENLESVFRVKTRVIGLEDRENPLIVIDP